MLGAETRAEIDRQPRIAAWLVLALALLVVVLGVYPQLFLQPAQEAARAFSLF